MGHNWIRKYFLNGSVKNQSQMTQYTMDLKAGLTQVLQDGTNTCLYGADRIAQYGANDPEYYLGDALGSVRPFVDG
jgi:hypothetical protein